MRDNLSEYRGTIL